MLSSSRKKRLACSFKLLAAAQVCLLFSACVTLDAAAPEILSGAQPADGKTRIVYGNARVLGVAIAPYNPATGAIGSCFDPKRIIPVATTGDSGVDYFAANVQPGTYVVAAYSLRYPEVVALAFRTIHSVMVPEGTQTFVGTFSEFLLAPAPGTEAARTWPGPIALDIAQARSDTGSDALLLAPLTEIDPPKSICTGLFMHRADHIGN